MSAMRVMRRTPRRAASESNGRDGGLALEVVAVWLLFVVVATEIFVTYARLPAYELYHVSGSGFAAGASRALVFLNFPTALVAIAILALLAERLRGRLPAAAAGLGIVLCAAVFWPGVVAQSDLDAKAVNAIAACGVLVTAALTVIVAFTLRRPPRLRRRSGDRFRVAIAAIAIMLALPWLAADLGFSFGGVPVLGTLYQTNELRSQPRVVGLHPAVHHGHHHGMDGVLLILTALLLSRVVPLVQRRWLRGALGAYLALMFCYSVGNVANDFWLEQVVKRGWTRWEIPDVTQPKATVAWGIIVLGTVAICAGWTSRARNARAKAWHRIGVYSGPK